MNNKVIYIVGFVVIAIMIIVILAYGASNGSEFGGADDGAKDVIAEVDPDFKQWTKGIWGDYELPSETASLLFALQAAIGAIIIGYFIGRYTKKKSEAEAQ